MSYELRIRLINSGINCSKAKRLIALTEKLERIMDLMACVLMEKNNLSLSYLKKMWLPFTVHRGTKRFIY